MSRPVRVLHLEDHTKAVERVKAGLDRGDLVHGPTWVNTREAFLAALRDAWNFDLLRVDSALPGIRGEAALELARAAAPGIPFSPIPGSLGEERAVEGPREGATGDGLKTNLARLAPVLLDQALGALLANAREIAVAHQGTLQLDSPPKLGAVLRILLPA